MFCLSSAAQFPKQNQREKWNDGDDNGDNDGDDDSVSAGNYSSGAGWEDGVVVMVLMMMIVMLMVRVL